MQRLTQALKIFRVRETGNLEFWISHAVVLLSTVLGVYLAALAGYKTAIEFEAVRTDRDGYYLRRALLDETKQNLDWGDKMAQAALADAREGGAHFNMGRQTAQTFVWETMKQQSATLQLPPDTLAAIREYYADVDGHVKAITKPMTPSDFRVKEAMAWQTETKKVRDAAVRTLERDLAEMRTELTAKGIKLR